eukprot:jgi/Mesvir1/20916/Mv07988-RA.1
MGLDPANYRFSKHVGETLVKFPGQIDGIDFLLEKLEGCSVYLLDFTAQVQVDLCRKCTIVIGPVDGSVFLRDCEDCTIYVACRQLRLRDCHRCKIVLYCYTEPVIELSDEIQFGCWNVAYPHLSEHFKKANLNPSVNTWSKIYDFNTGDEPHWTTLPQKPFEFLEVQLTDGNGLQCPPQCDNPVLAFDGQSYVPPPLPGHQSSSEEPVKVSVHVVVRGGMGADEDVSDGFGGGAGDLNGYVNTSHDYGTAGLGNGNTEPSPDEDDDSPTPLEQWMISNVTRLREKELVEDERKEELRSKARAYIAQSKEERAARIAAKKKQNRETEAIEREKREGGGASANPWETVVSYIDMSKAKTKDVGKPGKSKDVSRFRKVLFDCKNKAAAAKS